MVKVSIPHRYARNDDDSLPLDYCVRVSIPHRYARNAICSKVEELATQVSIPHRYARNPDLHHRLNLESRFQFLIGTLETEAMDRSSGVA